MTITNIFTTITVVALTLSGVFLLSAWYNNRKAHKLMEDIYRINEDTDKKLVETLAKTLADAQEEVVDIRESQRTLGFVIEYQDFDVWFRSVMLEESMAAVGKDWNMTAGNVYHAVLRLTKRLPHSKPEDYTNVKAVREAFIKEPFATMPYRELWRHFELQIKKANEG